MILSCKDSRLMILVISADKKEGCWFTTIADTKCTPLAARMSDSA